MSASRSSRNRAPPNLQLRKGQRETTAMTKALGAGLALLITGAALWALRPYAELAFIYSVLAGI